MGGLFLVVHQCEDLRRIRDNRHRELSKMAGVQIASLSIHGNGCLAQAYAMMVSQGFNFGGATVEIKRPARQGGVG